MKILLTNTVLLNGGDAAIMMAVAQQLREAFGPDAEVLVCEAQPEVSRRLYPDVPMAGSLYRYFLRPGIRGRWRVLWGMWRFALWYAALPRAYAAAWLYAHGFRTVSRALLGKGEWKGFESYATADLIVSTGGTYLVENYWLAPRLFEYRVAMMLKKPLVFYTQSLGPFRRPSLRRKLRPIFDYAVLTLVRDHRSVEHLRNLGVAPARIHRLPDAVFALDHYFAVSQPSAGGPLRVAVSVRHWPYFGQRSADEGMTAYRSAVAGVVTHLIEECDAEITFISTCQGVEAYTYDDARVAQDIVSQLSESVRSRVTVDAAFHRPDALLDSLASFDLVVATRMHMAILALKAGVPVVPIVYEFKTRELMDRIGYDAWSGGAPLLEIEQIDEQRLLAAVEAVRQRLPGLSRVINTRVDDVRREAQQAIGLLRASVSAHHGNRMLP